MANKHEQSTHTSRTRLLTWPQENSISDIKELSADMGQHAMSKGYQRALAWEASIISQILRSTCYLYKECFQTSVSAFENQHGYK